MRAITVHETPWTDEDRQYALAWQRDKDIHCTGCGERVDVSHASENQFAYESEIVRCHGCAANQKAARKFADNDGDQAGIKVRFTRRPGRN